MPAQAALLSAQGGTPFSWGLYQISSRINALGVTCEVWGFWNWRAALNKILEAEAKQHGTKIILGGYSQGAIRAVEASYELAKQNITVDLLITLVPAGPWYAGRNVKRFVNLYIPGGWLSEPIKPGPGFNGELLNVPIQHWSITHFNIDKAPSVQDRVVEEVRKVVSS